MKEEVTTEGESGQGWRGARAHTASNPSCTLQKAGTFLWEERGQVCSWKADSTWIREGMRKEATEDRTSTEVRENNKEVVNGGEAKSSTCIKAGSRSWIQVHYLSQNEICPNISTSLSY